MVTATRNGRMYYFKVSLLLRPWFNLEFDVLVRRVGCAWLRPAVVSLVCFGAGGFPPLPSSALAQGLTTAAIRGMVRSSDGVDVEGARVSVTNLATGFVAQREVRQGRFLIEGLEVGGPYTITVQRLGFQTQQVERVYLRLNAELLRRRSRRDFEDPAHEVC